MKDTNKNRLNAVDIIIIAVLILAVAVAAFIFLRPSGAADTGEGYIDFTIELPTVKDKFKGLIKDGDRVIETVRHATLGEVVRATYEDAKIATTDMENGGAMSMGDYPDHQRAEIVIRGKYSINENGEYTVAGITVAVGAYINFSTPDFITSGYCVGIDLLDEDESKTWEEHLKAQKSEEEAE